MTYQLHLQLDDSLEDALRAFADANHLSIAAAVRFLLAQALREIIQALTEVEQS